MHYNILNLLKHKGRRYKAHQKERQARNILTKLIGRQVSKDEEQEDYDYGDDYKEEQFTIMFTNPPRTNVKEDIEPTTTVLTPSTIKTKSKNTYTTSKVTNTVTEFVTINSEASTKYQEESVSTSKNFQTLKPTKTTVSTTFKTNPLTTTTTTTTKLYPTTKIDTTPRIFTTTTKIPTSTKVKPTFTSTQITGKQPSMFETQSEVPFTLPIPKNENKPTSTAPLFEKQSELPHVLPSSIENQFTSTAPNFTLEIPHTSLDNFKTISYGGLNKPTPFVNILETENQFSFLSTGVTPKSDLEDIARYTESGSAIPQFPVGKITSNIVTFEPASVFMGPGDKALPNDIGLLGNQGLFTTPYLELLTSQENSFKTENFPIPEFTHLELGKEESLTNLEHSTISNFEIFPKIDVLNSPDSDVLSTSGLYESVTPQGILPYTGFNFNYPGSLDSSAVSLEEAEFTTNAIPFVITDEFTNFEDTKVPNNEFSMPFIFTNSTEMYNLITNTESEYTSKEILTTGYPYPTYTSEMVLPKISDNVPVGLANLTSEASLVTMVATSTYPLQELSLTTNEFEATTFKEPEFKLKATTPFSKGLELGTSESSTLANKPPELISTKTVLPLPTYTEISIESTTPVTKPATISLGNELEFTSTEPAQTISLMSTQTETVTLPSKVSELLSLESSTILPKLSKITTELSTQLEFTTSELNTTVAETTLPPGTTNIKPSNTKPSNVSSTGPELLSSELTSTEPEKTILSTESSSSLNTPTIFEAQTQNSVISSGDKITESTDTMQGTTENYLKASLAKVKPFLKEKYGNEISSSELPETSIEPHISTSSVSQVTSPVAILTTKKVSHKPNLSGTDITLSNEPEVFSESTEGEVISETESTSSTIQKPITDEFGEVSMITLVEEKTLVARETTTPITTEDTDEDDSFEDAFSGLTTDNAFNILISEEDLTTAFNYSVTGTTAELSESNTTEQSTIVGETNSLVEVTSENAATNELSTSESSTAVITNKTLTLNTESTLNTKSKNVSEAATLSPVETSEYTNASSKEHAEASTPITNQTKVTSEISTLTLNAESNTAPTTTNLSEAANVTLVETSTTTNTLNKENSEPTSLNRTEEKNILSLTSISDNKTVALETASSFTTASQVVNSQVTSYDEASSTAKPHETNITASELLTSNISHEASTEVTSPLNNLTNEKSSTFLGETKNETLESSTLALASSAGTHGLATEVQTASVLMAESTETKNHVEITSSTVILAGTVESQHVNGSSSEIYSSSTALEGISNAELSTSVGSTESHYVNGSTSEINSSSTTNGALLSSLTVTHELATEVQTASVLMAESTETTSSTVMSVGTVESQHVNGGSSEIYSSSTALGGISTAELSSSVGTTESHYVNDSTSEINSTPTTLELSSVETNSITQSNYSPEITSSVTIQSENQTSSQTLEELSTAESSSNAMQTQVVSSFQAPGELSSTKSGPTTSETQKISLTTVELGAITTTAPIKTSSQVSEEISSIESSTMQSQTPGELSSIKSSSITVGTKNISSSTSEGSPSIESSTILVATQYSSSLTPVELSSIELNSNTTPEKIITSSYTSEIISNFESTSFTTNIQSTTAQPGSLEVSETKEVLSSESTYISTSQFESSTLTSSSPGYSMASTIEIELTTMVPSLENQITIPSTADISESSTLPTSNVEIATSTISSSLTSEIIKPEHEESTLTTNFVTTELMTKSNLSEITDVSAMFIPTGTSESNAEAATTIPIVITLPEMQTEISGAETKVTEIITSTIEEAASQTESLSGEGNFPTSGLETMFYMTTTPTIGSEFTSTELATISSINVGLESSKSESNAEVPATFSESNESTESFSKNRINITGAGFSEGFISTNAVSERLEFLNSGIAQSYFGVSTTLHEPIKTETEGLTEAITVKTETESTVSIEPLTYEPSSSAHTMLELIPSVSPSTSALQIESSTEFSTTLHHEISSEAISESKTLYMTTETKSETSSTESTIRASTIPLEIESLPSETTTLKTTTESVSINEALSTTDFKTESAKSKSENEITEATTIKVKTESQGATTSEKAVTRLTEFTETKTENGSSAKNTEIQIQLSTTVPVTHTVQDTTLNHTIQNQISTITHKEEEATEKESTIATKESTIATTESAITTVKQKESTTLESKIEITTSANIAHDHIGSINKTESKADLGTTELVTHEVSQTTPEHTSQSKLTAITHKENQSTEKESHGHYPESTTTFLESSTTPLLSEPTKLKSETVISESATTVQTGLVTYEISHTGQEHTSHSPIESITIKTTKASSETVTPKVVESSFVTLPIESTKSTEEIESTTTGGSSLLKIMSKTQSDEFTTNATSSKLEVASTLQGVGTIKSESIPYSAMTDSNVPVTSMFFISTQNSLLGVTSNFGENLMTLNPLLTATAPTTASTPLIEKLTPPNNTEKSDKDDAIFATIESLLKIFSSTPRPFDNITALTFENENLLTENILEQFTIPTLKHEEMQSTKSKQQEKYSTIEKANEYSLLTAINHEETTKTSPQLIHEATETLPITKSNVSLSSSEKTISSTVSSPTNKTTMPTTTVTIKNTTSSEANATTATSQITKEETHVSTSTPKSNTSEIASTSLHEESFKTKSSTQINTSTDKSKATSELICHICKVTKPNPGETTLGDAEEQEREKSASTLKKPHTTIGATEASLATSATSSAIRNITSSSTEELKSTESKVSTTIASLETTSHEMAPASLTSIGSSKITEMSTSTVGKPTETTTKSSTSTESKASDTTTASTISTESKTTGETTATTSTESKSTESVSTTTEKSSGTEHSSSIESKTTEETTATTSTKSKATESVSTTSTEKSSGTTTKSSTSTESKASDLTTASTISTENKTTEETAATTSTESTELVSTTSTQKSSGTEHSSSTKSKTTEETTATTSTESKATESVSTSSSEKSSGTENSSSIESKITETSTLTATTTESKFTETTSSAASTAFAESNAIETTSVAESTAAANRKTTKTSTTSATKLFEGTNLESTAPITITISTHTLAESTIVASTESTTPSAVTTIESTHERKTTETSPTTITMSKVLTIETPLTTILSKETSLESTEKSTTSATKISEGTNLESISPVTITISTHTLAESTIAGTSIESTTPSAVPTIESTNERKATETSPTTITMSEVSTIATPLTTILSKETSSESTSSHNGITTAKETTAIHTSQESSLKPQSSPETPSTGKQIENQPSTLKEEIITHQSTHENTHPTGMEGTTHETTSGLITSTVMHKEESSEGHSSTIESNTLHSTISSESIESSPSTFTEFKEKSTSHETHTEGANTTYSKTKKTENVATEKLANISEEYENSIGIQTISHLSTEHSSSKNYIEYNTTHVTEPSSSYKKLETTELSTNEKSLTISQGYQSEIVTQSNISTSHTIKGTETTAGHSIEKIKFISNAKPFTVSEEYQSRVGIETTSHTSSEKLSTIVETTSAHSTKSELVSSVQPSSVSEYQSSVEVKSSSEQSTKTTETLGAYSTEKIVLTTSKKPLSVTEGFQTAIGTQTTTNFSTEKPSTLTKGFSTKEGQLMKSTKLTTVQKPLTVSEEYQSGVEGITHQTIKIDISIPSTKKIEFSSTEKPSIISEEYQSNIAHKSTDHIASDIITIVAGTTVVHPTTKIELGSTEQPSTVSEYKSTIEATTEHFVKTSEKGSTHSTQKIELTTLEKPLTVSEEFQTTVSTQSTNHLSSEHSTKVTEAKTVSPTKSLVTITTEKPSTVAEEYDSNIAVKSTTHIELSSTEKLLTLSKESQSTVAVESSHHISEQLTKIAEPNSSTKIVQSFSEQSSTVSEDHQKHISVESTSHATSEKSTKKIDLNTTEKPLPISEEYQRIETTNHVTGESTKAAEVSDTNLNKKIELTTTEKLSMISEEFTNTISSQKSINATEAVVHLTTEKPSNITEEYQSTNHVSTQSVPSSEKSSEHLNKKIELTSTEMPSTISEEHHSNIAIVSTSQSSINAGETSHLTQKIATTEKPFTLSEEYTSTYNILNGSTSVEATVTTKYVSEEHTTLKTNGQTTSSIPSTKQEGTATEITTTESYSTKIDHEISSSASKVYESTVTSSTSNRGNESFLYLSTLATSEEPTTAQTQHTYSNYLHETPFSNELENTTSQHEHTNQSTEKTSTTEIKGLSTENAKLLTTVTPSSSEIETHATESFSENQITEATTISQRTTKETKINAEENPSSVSEEYGYTIEQHMTTHTTHEHGATESQIEGQHSTKSFEAKSNEKPLSEYQTAGANTGKNTEHITEKSSVLLEEFESTLGIHGTSHTHKETSAAHESSVEEYKSTVEGHGSTVEGQESTVNGHGNTVEGHGSTVDRHGSTVEGHESTESTSGVHDMMRHPTESHSTHKNAVGTSIQPSPASEVHLISQMHHLPTQKTTLEENKSSQTVSQVELDHTEKHVLETTTNIPSETTHAISGPTIVEPEHSKQASVTLLGTSPFGLGSTQPGEEFMSIHVEGMPESSPAIAHDTIAHNKSDMKSTIMLKMSTYSGFEIYEEVSTPTPVQLAEEKVSTILIRRTTNAEIKSESLTANNSNASGGTTNLHGEISTTPMSNHLELPHTSNEFSGSTSSKDHLTEHSSVEVGTSHSTTSSSNLEVNNQLETASSSKPPLGYKEKIYSSSTESPSSVFEEHMHVNMHHFNTASTESKETTTPANKEGSTIVLNETAKNHHTTESINTSHFTESTVFAETSETVSHFETSEKSKVPTEFKGSSTTEIPKTLESSSINHTLLDHKTNFGSSENPLSLVEAHTEHITSISSTASKELTTLISDQDHVNHSTAETKLSSAEAKLSSAGAKNSFETTTGSQERGHSLEGEVTSKETLLSSSTLKTHESEYTTQTLEITQSNPLENSVTTLKETISLPHTTHTSEISTSAEEKYTTLLHTSVGSTLETEMGSHKMLSTESTHITGTSAFNEITHTPSVHNSEESSTSTTNTFEGNTVKESASNHTTTSTGTVSHAAQVMASSETTHVLETSSATSSTISTSETTTPEIQSPIVGHILLSHFTETTNPSKISHLSSNIFEEGVETEHTKPYSESTKSSQTAPVTAALESTHALATTFKVIHATDTLTSEVKQSTQSPVVTSPEAIVLKTTTVTETSHLLETSASAKTNNKTTNSETTHTTSNGQFTHAQEVSSTTEIKHSTIVGAEVNHSLQNTFAEGHETPLSNKTTHEEINSEAKFTKTTSETKLRTTESANSGTSHSTTENGHTSETIAGVKEKSKGTTSATSHASSEVSSAINQSITLTHSTAITQEYHSPESSATIETSTFATSTNYTKVPSSHIETIAKITEASTVPPTKAANISHEEFHPTEMLESTATTELTHIPQTTEKHELASYKNSPTMESTSKLIEVSETTVSGHNLETSNREFNNTQERVTSSATATIIPESSHASLTTSFSEGTSELHHISTMGNISVQENGLSTTHRNVLFEIAIPATTAKSPSGVKSSSHLESNISTSHEGTTKENSKKVMTTTTLKEIFLDLPTYFPNSTVPVPNFENFYTTQLVGNNVYDDEQFDSTINFYHFHSMKLHDFDNITEFTTSSTNVNTSVSANQTGISSVSSNLESETTESKITTITETEFSTTAGTAFKIENETILNSELTEATVGKVESTSCSDNLGIENSTIRETTSASVKTTENTTNFQNISTSVGSGMFPEIGNILKNLNESQTSTSARTTIYEEASTQYELPICSFGSNMKKTCICSVDKLVKELQDKSFEKKLNSSLSTSLCETYIPLKNGIKFGKESHIHKRSRRRLLSFGKDPKPVSKREIIPNTEIEAALAKDFEFTDTETHKYTTPGSKVRIPCAEGKNLTSKDYNIKWTTANGQPLTEGKILETGSGFLVIENIVPQDGGNYTCTISNNYTGIRSFNHQLSVITLPKFDINTTILYKMAVPCQMEDVEVIKMYFNADIGNMICGKEHKICSVNIQNIHCTNSKKDKHFLYISVTFHLEPMNAIIPALNTTLCNVVCQMKIYAKLVSVIVNNIQVFETQPVIYEQSRAVILNPSHENATANETTESPKLIIGCPPGFGLVDEKHICLACSPNSFSGGGEAFCSQCPRKQFQPNVGSKSCLTCTSPLQDPNCLTSMIMDGAKFKTLAIGAFGFLIVVIVGCLCVHCRSSKTSSSKKRNHDKNHRVKRNKNNDDVERQELLHERKPRSRRKRSDLSPVPEQMHYMPPPFKQPLQRPPKPPPPDF